MIRPTCLSVAPHFESGVALKVSSYPTRTKAEASDIAKVQQMSPRERERYYTYPALRLIQAHGR